MDNRQYLEIKKAYSLSFSRKDNNFSNHSHQFFELLCVINGRCMINIRDTKIELSEFQCILIDANVVHKLEIEEPCAFCCLCFEYSSIKKEKSIDIKQLSLKYIPISAFFCEKKSYTVFEKAPNICHSVKDLLSEIQKQDTNADYLVELLFERALIEITRTFESDNTKSFSYLNKAKNYIYKDYSNSISVSSISKVVGLSSSYLQSLFKEHLKCSIMEYVNKLRLEQASILLIHTNKCIIDIAIDVGFNSRQQFGRAFSKFYLISPKKYRIMYSNVSNLIISPYEDANSVGKPTKIEHKK